MSTSTTPPLKVDLRSDTVTRPSPAMRRAMAEATVDDDVLGHDPTMAQLEQRTAELLGKEAGLFMMSGCMSNLTAMMLHLRRGDQFLAPRFAHILQYELGTVSWLAGGTVFELEWGQTPGVPKLSEVAAIAQSHQRPHAYYELLPRLLTLENTHNHAGGSIIPKADYDALVNHAHSAGWQVHLDGARLWHAASALGISLADAAGQADTVSVCFSKGMGAPVGSVLCFTKEMISQARRVRKMLGGGVRQGGVLAAAALVALDEELPRIDQDRLRAVRLAQGLNEMGFDAAQPPTNIVMVHPGQASQSTAAELAAAWTAAGVGCVTMGTAVRLVTHRDISDQAIDQALDLIQATLS
ncbi:MAG: aminotransferase class I/II-fold pyridoxal phosphate-dependent enzyme [Micrococcales bacterium]|nr:aminotransferase class I/II-fold pyridoxal phosphate-dependent enzyme [Micrococcales bacterium]